LAEGVDVDAGPVLVTVEYRVPAENRVAFLAGLKRVCRERRRDGAYSWQVYQDVTQPERMVETFVLDSWLEHLRQHRRVTQADRLVEEHLRPLVREDPRITHYIAPQLDGTSPA
jgi:quinol monooxygenase YgiN